ncbi:MAG: glycosyltransferase family 4 protein [Flammeovirgaceae bacterium]
MESKNSILVLYAEFMPYNVSAFGQLAKDSDADVYVVFWDTRKVSPYQPEKCDRLIYIPRSSVTYLFLTDFLRKHRPKLVFVSGWADKLYLRIAYKARRLNINVIVGFDNHWVGNLRQILLGFLFKLARPYFFSCAFVPGVQQYHYSRRLGFKHTQILTGVYTANTNSFVNAGKIVKASSRKKSILFVGRLEKVKGVDLLINCFAEIIQKRHDLSDWKIYFVGEGTLVDTIPNSTAFIRMGFMTQQDISKLTEEVSFFCLPSRNEPWGLVVHEMSTAGLPMLLSDQCGAATEFLVPGFNGLIFRGEDSQDLQEKLIEMMMLNETQWMEWSRNSVLLSTRNSSEIWAKKLTSVIN